MDTLTNQPIPSPHSLYGLFVPINWSQYPLCNLNIFFHNQLSTTVPPIHPILNQQIHMLIKDCKLCAKMFKTFLRVRNVFKLILSVSIHKIIVIIKKKHHNICPACVKFLLLYSIAKYIPKGKNSLYIYSRRSGWVNWIVRFCSHCEKKNVLKTR